MDTFLDCARRVLLRVPGAPLLLAEDWVVNAYRAFCAAHPWSFQRKDAALRFRVARSVACTVTQYSSTVTSAGLFLPADAGRQFRVTNTPIYTIQTVVDINTVTLDRNYEDSSGAVAGTILDAYPALPLDFGHFLSITNPYEQRVIQWGVSSEYLDEIDPYRVYAGSYLRLLAARKVSQVTATQYQYLYEGWPIIITARSYPYLYKTTPGTISEATTFTGILGQYASSVLVTGALLECSKWPGTTEHPNPYRSDPRLSQELQLDWDRQVQALWLQDDAAFPMQLIQTRQNPQQYSPSTEGLRQTDATITDYL